MEPALSPFESFLEQFTSQESRLMKPSGKQGLLGMASLWLQQAMPVDLKVFNDPNHVYATCWECRWRIR